MHVPCLAYQAHGIFEYNQRGGLLIEDEYGLIALQHLFVCGIDNNPEYLRIMKELRECKLLRREDIEHMIFCIMHVILTQSCALSTL